MPPERPLSGWNGLVARSTQQVAVLPLWWHRQDAPVGNDNARLYDSAYIPTDTKLSFSTNVVLPLDFENSTYVYFAGDQFSPDIGAGKSWRML